jgi:signal peptidase I
MKELLRGNRGFIIFLLCFGFFRTAIADWNPIPSGSMRPTLLEGDVVLVNRLAYDFKLPLTDIAIAHLAEPRRGDIVTFSSPKDGTRLIKRVVATPGDRIELKDEVLLINDEIAVYDNQSLVREPVGHGMELDALRATERVADSQHAVQFLPAVRARRDFGPMVVPAGSYFMLGDNRDDSADSRYFGFVPRHLLIGRAHRVLLSADIKGDWSPRFARTGQALH